MRGLTSITFRKMSPEDIITHAVAAGIEGIEWGSDVHIPPHDRETARRIGGKTRDAGLAVTSYGTYYRLGSGEHFSHYLDAAEALGAPQLRLWAGTRGSADIDPTTRRVWVEEARRCAELAAVRGLVIAFEYHHGTLTDESESAVRLMQEIDHPACRLYWQPEFSKPATAVIEGLLAVRPYLAALHVFQWNPDHTRRPLADGVALWRSWLDLVPEARELPCLLEFVPDDDPVVLPREVDALRAILASAI